MLGVAETNLKRTSHQSAAHNRTTISLSTESLKGEKLFFLFALPLIYGSGSVQSIGKSFSSSGKTATRVNMKVRIPIEQNPTFCAKQPLMKS